MQHNIIDFISRQKHLVEDEAVKFFFDISCKVKLRLIYTAHNRKFMIFKYPGPQNGLILKL